MYLCSKHFLNIGWTFFNDFAMMARVEFHFMVTNIDAQESIKTVSDLKNDDI